MSKNQRTVGNFFKNASLSRSYQFNLFVAGLVVFSILLLIASQQMNEVSVASGSLPGSPLSAFLEDKLQVLSRLFFATFVLYLVGTVAYITLMAQRIGGPKVSILRYIDDLKQGIYEKPRPLRKGDELGDVMEKLEELAEILKAKKGS